MIDARTLTLDLGGKWYRTYGAAPCPVCQPERRKGQNALTVNDGRDGRLLVHCKKSGCVFRDVMAAADVSGAGYAPPDPETLAQREAEHRAEVEKRSRQARALWKESQPIAGTLAETYLRGRGITCGLPGRLRYQPACWHPSAKRLPALVALVEGGEGFAVHRTYLATDGKGKADVDPDKAMLGAVAGGAVRLTNGQGPLVVAEGIETALSLASGLLSGPATVWAALSTSGMSALALPPDPGRLTVASDGDAPGREAAHKLADRAHALGWQVSLLPAPDGCDWNDILRMKGEAA
ncbi:MAG: toprim domain-containing protein [Maritimibacter sp.]|nr:toprim domain-containing protein [Maritimibacter sp.]